MRRGFMPVLMNLVAGAVLFAVYLLVFLGSQPASIGLTVGVNLLVDALFLMLNVGGLAGS
jgi:inner membrane protein involved in colicin E2 resistance